MEIKVKVNLTEKDAMLFYFYGLKKFATIWAPLIFVFFCCLDLINFQRVFLSENVTGTGNCFLVYALFTFWIAKFMWKNSVIQKEDEDTDCTFMDTGIRWKTESLTMSLSYGKLLKARETQAAFYVDWKLWDPLIIPKRCFENAEDIQTVRELFIKNMPPKKVRLMKAS